MVDIILGDGGTEDVPGEPIDVSAAPGPMSLEDAKHSKIVQIDKNTESILNNSGVSIAFDFGGGADTYAFAATKAAKMNWILLLNCARDCMDSKVPEGNFFPMPVQTFPDEAFHTLSTAASAFQFAYTVLGAIENFRASGAVLKNAVAAATSLEEVEAVVDDR